MLILTKNRFETFINFTFINFDFNINMDKLYNTQKNEEYYQQI